MSALPPGTVLCTLRKPCPFAAVEVVLSLLRQAYGVEVALDDRQRDRDVYYAIVVAG